jgi:hypothetical protein
MQFAICGQRLTAPKLNTASELDCIIDAQIARRRADRCIERIDRALGDRCVYCSSGLYDVPARGCPACVETRDERRPHLPMMYRGGGPVISVR